ncbi:hypothetical protein PHMEG_00033418 [Phytophthora megakarya]|uniref:Chromo domain-containing protein n=1 Tax=Phytophthora megakarya TaxID=4795 RepID=A0A225UU61_9STRA|nr:hypothetical protein PHMEG_00033418 [Phytophthora megakarya]
MQSVRVYAEDQLQQDWDEIAEKLIFAINNSMDTTRKETPFSLVHGGSDRGLGHRCYGRNEVSVRSREPCPVVHGTSEARIDEKNLHIDGMDQEFAYELKLPDRSRYRFYPVVHVSRLKMVEEFGDRPSTRLTQEVDEASRLDFDEELLPEDSWEPDHVAGEFEVEAILDDRTPLSTSTERAVREFKVKWVGYDDPTWEPASNLSCGGLLYDYLPRKTS